MFLPPMLSSSAQVIYGNLNWSTTVEGMDNCVEILRRIVDIYSK